MEIVVPTATVHREPSVTSMQVTQALYGEKLKVFDESDAWLKCQLLRDGYEGYIVKDAVADVTSNPTHRVFVPSTLMYPLADIKSQPVVILPMNAQVEVTESDEKFSKLSNGKFVYSTHLKPCDDYETDFVGVAEKFLDVPYLWGGKTIHGLDCSGLVQASLEACGVHALRDADMQENQLGQKLLINDLDGLRRGDLVFWKGHVGIMCDDRTLLHANGHHMMTVKEPLAEAAQRITSPITSIKRF